MSIFRFCPCIIHNTSLLLQNLLEEGCRVAVDGIDLILIPRNGAHDPHMPDSADIVASFEKNLDEFQHELARELDETVKSESVDAPAELSRQYSEDACDEVCICVFFLHIYIFCP